MLTVYFVLKCLFTCVPYVEVGETSKTTWDCRPPLWPGSSCLFEISSAMLRHWPQSPGRPVSGVALKLEKLHWIIVTLNVRLFHLPKPKTILISLWYKYNAQSQVYEDLKINPLWWKFSCNMETWFHPKAVWSGDWSLCKLGNLLVCAPLCHRESAWSWTGSLVVEDETWPCSQCPTSQMLMNV